MKLKVLCWYRVFFLVYIILICILLSSLHFGYDSSLAMPHVAESLLYVLFSIIGGIIWSLYEIVQGYQLKQKKLSAPKLIGAILCILLALMRVWEFTIFSYVPFPSIITEILNIKFFEIFFGFTAGTFLATCMQQKQSY